MDLITTSIIAAIANLGKDAINDSYKALKFALKKKFGTSSDLLDAVNKLEKSPDRDDRKATLKIEVEISKINNDSELLNLAQNLLDKIKEESDLSEDLTIREVKSIGDASVAIGKIQGSISSIGGIHGKK